MYKDKNGKTVKSGDRISFTLHDGIDNNEFDVRWIKNPNSKEKILFPPLMKYCEFTIIKSKPTTRIIAIDTETKSIHTVVSYDPTNKDETKRCILEQRLFYPRYGEKLTEYEKQKRIGHSYTHQLIEKLQFFIINKTQ